jgi:uncharacterized membrane protein
MGIALLTLALVGTASLLGTTLLAYTGHPGPLWMKGHFLAALGTTFLLVMAHSFIMFFLIATGVELKKMEQEKGWGDSFRRRTIVMKSRAFPLMTVALLLVLANFVLGAAAHTRALPPLVHEALAWTTLLVCVLALHREYRVLGENNRLIAEAASRREGVALSA